MKDKPSKKGFDRESIHVNGVLTPEAQKSVDDYIVEAENSPEYIAMKKRLDDSRKLTAEDYNWTATI